MKHDRKILIRMTRNQNCGAFIQIATIIAIAKIIWSVASKIKTVAVFLGPHFKICLSFVILRLLTCFAQNPIGSTRCTFVYASIYIGDVGLGTSVWSPPYHRIRLLFVILRLLTCFAYNQIVSGGMLSFVPAYILGCRFWGRLSGPPHPP